MDNIKEDPSKLQNADMKFFQNTPNCNLHDRERNENIKELGVEGESVQLLPVIEDGCISTCNV